MFMLTRHKHDLFHLPHNMSLTDTEARVLLRSDDGAPTGPMEDKGAGNTSPHVFERKFENAVVRLDCNSFSAEFMSALQQ